MPSTHLGSPVIPPEGGTLSPRGVKADYKIEDCGYETPCWIWQKHISKPGYGTGSFITLKITTNWAHRAYFIIAHGPLADGEEVHHKCKTCACVNPAHLERITERDHDVESFLTDRAGGLTLDDVREIRQLGRIQGYTSHGVAETYGIHWRTVDDYWGGRRWAAEFGDGPCRPVGPCAYCGATFTALRSRKQRFCSKHCKNESYNRGRGGRSGGGRFDALVRREQANARA